MQEQHGLKKYKAVNALTTDNPLALVAKIKENPEDYERYKLSLIHISEPTRPY